MKKLAGVVAPLVLIAALAVGTGTVPAGDGASVAGKKKAKVFVGNNFFRPKKKTVKRGTKVKFKWEGGVPHNVKKRKGPGRKFKSKTTSAKGVQYKKKFKKKGTYKLICTIHRDSMRMKLRVR